jgi:RNA polymerase sigma-70 factor (ECF subfamily)
VSIDRVTGNEPDGAWALVDDAKSGSVAAVAGLYKAHVNAVFGYVFKRTGDRHLAEDVTSETFLRALDKLGSVTYRGAAFRSWLITIARNLSTTS